MALAGVLRHVPRWGWREQEALTCAVVRHAERADSNPWEAQEAGHIFLSDWQLDPSLSLAGLQHSSKLGADLLKASGGAPARFGIVVSSPYLRCVQTAVQICKALGPDVALLLDNQLGEVYGTETMGDAEPETVLRPFAEIQQFCQAQGVQLCPRVLGRWPSWPERRPAARVRLLQRFLRYLHRSMVTRRNCVLVTHGDGVAAMLNAMPVLSNRVVRHVDFGGFFVARADLGKPGLSLLEQDLGTTTQAFERDLEGTGGEQEVPPSTTQAFRVVYSNIKVGGRLEESLSTRISRWAQKCCYTERQIRRLLRYCPDPIDEVHVLDRERQLEHSPASTIGELKSFPSAQREEGEGSACGSDAGASTVLFGTSEEESPLDRYHLTSPPHSPNKLSRSCSPRASCNLFDRAGISPAHTPQKLYVDLAVEPSTLPKKKNLISL